MCIKCSNFYFFCLSFYPISFHELFDSTSFFFVLFWWEFSYRNALKNKKKYTFSNELLECLKRCGTQFKSNYFKKSIIFTQSLTLQFFVLGFHLIIFIQIAILAVLFFCITFAVYEDSYQFLFLRSTCRAALLVIWFLLFFMSIFALIRMRFFSFRLTWAGKEVHISDSCCS